MCAGQATCDFTVPLLEDAKAITTDSSDCTREAASKCYGAYRSAVAQFWAELDGTWHEGPATAGNFLASAIKQNSLGDIEPLRAANNLAAGEELAIGHGPQKI